MSLESAYNSMGATNIYLVVLSILIFLVFLLLAAWVIVSENRLPRLAPLIHTDEESGDCEQPAGGVPKKSLDLKKMDPEAWLTGVAYRSVLTEDSRKEGGSENEDKEYGRNGEYEALDQEDVSDG